jgi:hypothetical protein
VSTNDWNVEVGRVLLASDLGNEGLGADDIEGGDTEQLLGVKDASVLEDLGGNGDGRVDGVGDDKDEGLGQCLTMPSMRPLTMPALILKRSSRVMPGLPLRNEPAIP